MKITSCLLFVFLAITSSSNASVIIMGTRVIYPAQQKSINIQLSNNEAEPSLIQSWIDTGDSESAPDSVKVPFIINPPVFRIEPKSGQTLRITYTQEKLPNNKESLFYLNVLD
ncbi:fimbria/pilus periplasmic chaperone, partial [Morganella morganii]